jgi:type I restriction enzyme S subunit
MPSINTKLLGEIPITYPDIDTQRKIAQVLAAVDDQIENNSKINDNLAA